MQVAKTLSWAAVLVVPAWLVFRRVLFGLPAGWEMLLAAVMAPVIAGFLGILMWATWMRPDVRRTGRLESDDAWSLGLLVAGFILMGVFDVQGNAGSVFTQIAGTQFMELSRWLGIALALATAVGAIVVFRRQTRKLARVAREEAERYVQNVEDELAGRARAEQGEATFSPVIDDAEIVEPEIDPGDQRGGSAQP